jgi:putative ABC transport system permease protein
MEQTKELYRDRRGLPGLETLLQDVRYAFRGVRKSPGFAFIAILALALGIGASTLMFSVLDTVLLNPFPYKNTGRDVVVSIQDVARPDSGGNVNLLPEQLLAYREQTHSFAYVSAVTDFDGSDMAVRYSDREGTREAFGLELTTDMFPMLGMRPVLGRVPNEEDAKPDAPPVVAISYRFWNAQLGRDPAIVGNVIKLNDQPRTVIGVMPPRFLIGDADFWAPYKWRRTKVDGDPVLLNPLWQLKPGVSKEAAAADVQAVAKRLARIYPDLFPKRFAIVVQPWAETVVGRFSALMYMLMAAVIMLLLIACSNVANLLLARAIEREREIAIRAAIGASRARLARQLLSESFVLAAAACTTGCAFAYVSLKLVSGMLPPDFVPAESVVRISPAALLFAVSLTIATTLLCGLAPALHGAGGKLYGKLVGSGRGSGGSIGHGALRSGLVIGEVALSIVLLVGMGLMVRSLVAMRHLDLGFDPANILIGRIVLPRKSYESAEQKQVFFSELLRRVAALPGVEAATEISSSPVWGGSEASLTAPSRQTTATWSTVELCSQDYFRVYGIRLLRGRVLSQKDVEGAQPVAVVNQTLTHAFFGNTDPIGQTIRIENAPSTEGKSAFQIIGVVADTKNRGLQFAPMPEAFLPGTIAGLADGLGDRGIAIKTAVQPESLMETVQRKIWDVDPRVAFITDGSLQHQINERYYSEPELGAVMLSSFGGISLALVVIGIFSVMAHSVSLQTHDIGVRMALGAREGDVLRMVLRKGLTLILIGIGLGEAVSAVLTRLAASQVWGVSARDPITFGGVVVVSLGVGAAACFWPARRAMKVDPMVALRYE